MKEILLGGFWGVTYILIVIFSIKYRSEKKVFMPLIAGMLNFIWEILALYTSGGYWVHILWLLLDCFIISYNIYILGTIKRRLIYVILTLACFPLLYWMFQSSSFDGMLVSSFIIDIIMATEYLAFVNKLSEHGRTVIGLTRLLGDFFAWYGNMHHSTFVLIVGIMVLIINLIYIVASMSYRELQQNKPVPKQNIYKKKKHKKK